MKQSALSIVKKLRQAGYKAYFAGGAVRDMLLGKAPKDYDIATSAKPEQIEELVERSLPIGKAFGVILVQSGEHWIEVTSFRKDHDYKNGRKPEKVSFCDEKEDVLRRDFTINGLFYDPLEKKYIDYVRGEEDLNKKIVRFIGNSEERILEDYLRIIRAVRIKNMLNFSYEEQTYKALKKYASLVEKISKERVYNELIRMFSCEHSSDVIKDMDDLGILALLFPELEEMKGVKQPPQYHQEGDVWIHMLLALDSLPKESSYILRLAVVFHDIAKPKTQGINKKGYICFYAHDVEGKKMVQEILKRLKFPKKEIEAVAFLVGHHMMMESVMQMTKKRRSHWFSHPLFSDLLLLMKADIQGTRPQDFSLWEELKNLYQEWKNEEDHKAPELPITGRDIMKHFQIPQGRQVGDLLHKAEEAFFDEKVHTKKEILSFLEKFIQKK